MSATQEKSTESVAPTESDPRFFHPSLAAIPPAFADLLEDYSKIPRPDQIHHVLSLRNQAYGSHPYPCLGRFRFLDLDLSSHPLYKSHLIPTLVSTAQSGQEPLFLDFGCCIGQDLRKLRHDGAPVSRLYGSDINPAYIEIGYGLFKDETSFPRDHFLTPADAFEDSPSSPLVQLDGKVTILHISAVFHLFGLQKQETLAQRCLRLLNRKAGKCLILGGQTANVKAGNYGRIDGSTRWRHDEKSWQSLWEEAAGKDGGCKVQVSNRLEERGFPAKDKSGKYTFGPNEEPPKVIGLTEEGFRWSVWSVWVDFDS